MNEFSNKIDFVVFISVTMANPNGDPLNGNRPRMGYDGIGEISDVCIKRKIRNRMQDLGKEIFIQSDDRCKDGCKSLQERFKELKKGHKEVNERDDEQLRKLLCQTYLDVRTFGGVFAFNKKDKNSKEDGVSIGIRGPVSIHHAKSISPIDINSIQITKSTNGQEENDGKKSSDTMGMKHSVCFGLYKIQGSINVQLAQKTGFSEKDAETVKNCLMTLFVNDSSSARPDGSMEVTNLYWFKHNCSNGQYSSAQVHRSVQVKLKDPNAIPSSIDDYSIERTELEGLSCEEFDREAMNVQINEI